MKIKTIEYRCLKSYGRYENVSIGATAEVEEGHEATALADLEVWVNRQIQARIKEAEDREEEEWRTREASRTLEELNRDIAEAKERWEQIRKFTEKLGGSIEKLGVSVEEIPF